MQYFERFTSNTTAGSANQSYFINKKEKEISLGRVFYKIFAGGEYNYSILFSNTIDSTFADGSHSHKNKVLDEWFIHHVRLAVCSECSMEDMPTVENFVYATFDGKKEKAVAPGELFYTDEVSLNISEGEYLCVEIAFSGREIPCHPELQIPSFVYDGE